jgi:hypothetical protein
MATELISVQSKNFLIARNCKRVTYTDIIIIIIIPRSVAPSATALQQDVYLLQMQFPNL